VGFAEENDIFDAFHPAYHDDNAEQQDIREIMFFTPVDPGVRNQGKFGPYVHFSPPSLRLFLLFLEEVYNAIALYWTLPHLEDRKISGKYNRRGENDGKERAKTAGILEGMQGRGGGVGGEA
jgi:hypothetical protein